MASIPLLLFSHLSLPQLPREELAAMVALEWDAQLDKRRGIVPGTHLLLFIRHFLSLFLSFHANNDLDFDRY